MRSRTDGFELVWRTRVPARADCAVRRRGWDDRGVIPLHMGALHPFEQALTLLLAFGPFVLLGLVIWWRRAGERRTDARSAAVESVDERLS